MTNWRFFQGLKNEWRWYQFGKTGDVISSSDLSFSELAACMANAERAGFNRSNYQVHARRDAVIPEESILAISVHPK
ncbi:MAG: hypothetical protein JWN13_6913 [Betaproteobacteria bacterium]|nr:hypothetical protein [Betaproteobacteria bacterium]